ncbi:hypothetical protein K5D50_10625 [Pseudomonas cichorii]|nr:hypothetical protein [Pseudomonas cichorii]
MRFIKTLLLMMLMVSPAISNAAIQTAESVKRDADVSEQCVSVTKDNISFCSPSMVMKLGVAEVFSKSVMNESTAALASHITNSVGSLAKNFGVDWLPTDIQFEPSDTSAGPLAFVFNIVATFLRWVFILFAVSYGCKTIYHLKTSDKFLQNQTGLVYAFVSPLGVLLMCGLPYLSNVIFACLFAGLAILCGFFVHLYSIWINVSANDSAAAQSVARQQLIAASAPIFDMLVINAMNNTRRENAEVIVGTRFDGAAFLFNPDAFNQCIQNTEVKPSVQKSGLLFDGAVERTRACMKVAGVRSYNAGIAGYNGFDKDIEAGFTKLADAASAVAYMMNQKMCSQTLDVDDRRHMWADYGLAYDFCLNKDKAGKVVVDEKSRLSFLPHVDVEAAEIRAAKAAAITAFADSFSAFADAEQKKYSQTDFKITDLFSATVGLFNEQSGIHKIQSSIMSEFQKITVNNNDMQATVSTIQSMSEDEKRARFSNFDEMVKRSNIFDYTSSLAALRDEQSTALQIKQMLISAGNDANSQIYQRSGFSFSSCYASRAEMQKCITPQLNQVSSFMSDTLTYLNNLGAALVVLKLGSHAANTFSLHTAQAGLEFASLVVNLALIITVTVAICAIYPFITFLLSISRTILTAFYIYVKIGVMMLTSIFMFSSTSRDQEGAMNVHFAFLMNSLWLLINPSLSAALLFLNLGAVSLMLPLLNELVYTVSDSVVYNDGSVLNTVISVAIQFSIFQIFYLSATIGLDAALKKVSIEFEKLMSVSGSKDFNSEEVFGRVESAMHRFR